ncbi:MAG: hypothetical protein M1840_004512 [Geoglossum simile]|nr:MAG: hypothetical protein M1840_004512 [Geoglossum simile]
MDGLISLLHHANASLSDDITPSPDLPWNPIGPAEDNLLRELEGMYWQGVRQELEVILLTLKKWQQPEFNSVELSDETDDLIHGFDTFVDQVSQESRAFAIRYGKMRENCVPNAGKQYKDALRDRSLDVNADSHSSELKSGLRASLEDRQPSTLIERRARMLLQSAAFLDIDKLIEHRPPLNNTSFWNRPAIPQLALSRFDRHSMPIFSPLPCSACGSIITGSMFYNPENRTMGKICEGCYRMSYAGKDSLVKSYKYCILAEAIGPSASRKICRCITVPHSDNHTRALFPVSKDDNHQSIDGLRSRKCGLLKLGEVVAEAKYDGMQSMVGRSAIQIRRPTLREIRRKDEKTKKDEEEKERKKAGKAARKGDRRTMAMSQPSLQNSNKRTPATGSTPAVQENEADKDIPFFFRPYTERYPWENVHMALRLGPLVIENGVSHTKDGALITVRDSPSLHSLREPRIVAERSLALSGDQKRTLWWRQALGGKPKRYKAAVKQVVGVAFSGLLDQQLEHDIVSGLIAASKRKFDDSGIHVSEQRKILNEVLEQLLSKIKVLIGSRVQVYLQTIASSLLNPHTILRWSATKNNCQNFCDALICQDTFGALMFPVSKAINDDGGTALPLYMMSFVCRPAGYVNRPVKTKFDVPSGLTEEYLLKFRYGRRDEADIVDTLQEYWYDWGAFGGNLYRYQDLFPWDCTEAFGRYPVTCNDCNLAKHVWAFPFDSWSIISLHLTRNRDMYAPAKPEKLEVLSEEDWMRNRLHALVAQDVLLTAGAAMARNAAFRQATDWLHTQNDPSLDRLKLGGYPPCPALQPLL